MAKKTREEVAGAKRLMAALVRMPPKPHEDMKLNKKPAEKKTKKPAR
jgi:hypothetical protein